jgi:phosphoribosylanthranilate isomerase
MFRIKICGVTNPDDARAAIDAGADALGFNFYRSSKRFISTEIARQIVADVGSVTQPVGVFVNASVDEICDICRASAINVVQLHGEKRLDVGKLTCGLLDPMVSVIHARSFGARGMDAVHEDMFDASGMAGDAILVDAAVSGMYGGTGQTIDWTRLVNFQNSIGKMHLILAGGLTPENVAEAIRIVRPHAVDVASGVESSPGKKDAAKVRDFVAAAREAFDQI